jgi:Mrp family chromosome partitioning ATPase/uncharacterized protein involved in exopolysaccharide biosynthesis
VSDHDPNEARTPSTGLSVLASDATQDASVLSHVTEVRDFIEDHEPRPSSPITTVLRSLRGRYLTAALLAALFAALGGVAGFMASKPMYISRGTIQISASKPAILYGDPDNAFLRMFDAFVLAESSSLESRSMIERALSRLPADDNDWPTAAEGIRGIQEAISVERKEGLIFLEAKHHNPKTAASIVNSMLEAYEESHIEQRRREDSIRERELSQRETELLERIRSIDTETLAIGQEYGPRSIVTAHVSKVSQIAAVDERLAEVSTSIANREAEVAVLEVDVGDEEIKRLIMLDHAMADLITRRAELTGELAAELTESMKLRHPGRYKSRSTSPFEEKIRILDTAIENRRQQITTLGSTGALTKKESTGGDPNSVEQLRLLRSRLEVRLDELREEARELHSKLIKLEFLQGEREECRGHLEETRAALERVRLESEHRLPGLISVKARGNMPDEPAVDKRKQLAVAGAGAGGIGGLAVVVAYAFIVRRYRFSDEMDGLAAFGRPAGALPMYGEPDDALRRSYRRAIDRMRIDLQLSGPMTRSGIVIAVTGLRAKAGVSTVALSLAESFAKSRIRTVVVDADLVERRLSQTLGLVHAPGLTEALGKKSLNGEVHVTPHEYLSAIPAGVTSDFTDENLARGPLTTFLDQLRTGHDVSILDVGPFGERLVARLAAALSDQSLLVVPAGCDGGEAESAASALSRLAPQRVSFVFNFARVGDPGLIPPRMDASLAG